MKVVNDAKAVAEERFQQLLSSPQAFCQKELEHLVETFRPRLTIDDLMALTARRIRNREGDSLEKRALLAIIEGRFGEAEHLFGVIDRRKNLGLSVVTSTAPVIHVRSS